MLIEFSVSNFLSISERVTFSMVRSKNKELEESNTFQPDAQATPALLKSAVIYGPNAAGKSNIIFALRFMERFILNSATNKQLDDDVNVTPFLLDDECIKRPSEFEVSFVCDGVRYQYGFSANKKIVVEEWLLAYPKGRPQRLIEREFCQETNSYLWGTMDKLTGPKQTWRSATRPNALFLSTAIQLNCDQLKPVFEWFRETIHITASGMWRPEFTVEECEDSDEKKNRIIEFLKAADVGLAGLKFVEEDLLDDSVINMLDNDIKKHFIKKFKDETQINIKTIHLKNNKDVTLFDMDNESSGTKKLFALAGPWLDALENGYIAIIDELHNSLHPVIVKNLIKMFHSTECNKKNAQLIFTTHDTSILSQEVFRRDQIWFCMKNEEQATELYPLTVFSARKGVENLERSYLSGRYGALPFPKELESEKGC